VHVSEANNLIFKDNSFDYVFCYGLFQYLPEMEYAEKVLDEFDRVSTKGLYLGDLKDSRTRKEHFVYPKEKLREKGFKFTKCIHTPEDKTRYNAYRLKES